MYTQFCFISWIHSGSAGCDICDFAITKILSCEMKWITITLLFIWCRMLKDPLTDRLLMLVAIGKKITRMCTNTWIFSTGCHLFLYLTVAICICIHARTVFESSITSFNFPPMLLLWFPCLYKSSMNYLPGYKELLHLLSGEVSWCLWWSVLQDIMWCYSVCTVPFHYCLWMYVCYQMHLVLSLCHTYLKMPLISLWHLHVFLLVKGKTLCYTTRHNAPAISTSTGCRCGRGSVSKSSACSKTVCKCVRFKQPCLALCECIGCHNHHGANPEELEQKVTSVDWAKLTIGHMVFIS